MPANNNNFPLLDPPIFQSMTATPVASAAGCCLSSDGVRYIYVMFNQTNFWRYDTWADMWMQLPSPTAGGTFGAGCTVKYDPVNKRVWYLTGGAAAPVWSYFNIVTGAWSAAQSVVNLAATWGTDGAIAFPNTQIGGPSDDLIYVIGNASTVLYRYSISGNSWINTLTAQPSACGGGCEFQLMPGMGGDNDRLLRLRGGATTTIDYYDISANAWTNLAYQPLNTAETFTTGSAMAVLLTGASGPRAAIQKDNTGRIFELNLATLALPVMNGLGTQNAVSNAGAAVAGNRMDSVAYQGIEYLFFIPNTASTLVRALLPKNA